MVGHVANTAGQHQALRLLKCLARDVAAAIVVTLGGHAEPISGAAGARDLTGMTNPHVTQQNIRSMPA
jgi:hypothetical protein